MTRPAAGGGMPRASWFLRVQLRLLLSPAECEAALGELEELYLVRREWAGEIEAGHWLRRQLRQYPWRLLLARARVRFPRRRGADLDTGIEGDDAASPDGIIPDAVPLVSRSWTVDALWQDVRYALRALRRRPLFAAIVMLTLGLGIGANTAIFSVLNAALLRPLPFPEPERMVKVSLVTSEEPDMVWSWPKYELLRDEQHFLAAVAGYAGWQGNLAGTGDPERLQGERVTAHYFELLGVRPRAGRVFTEEETRDPGRAGVALLGERLWRGRFQADPGVVGRTVQLDGAPVIVVGVIPAGFRGLSGAADISCRWPPLAAR